MSLAPDRLRLTPLELGWAIPIGPEPSIEALPAAAGETAREAFEAVVLRALRRPPCVVSFSGGRDSSAVLAVATAVARREGLAPPIPVTNRFPGRQDTDESDWQELVVEHLGLRDWERLEWGDELDVVGPVARDALTRHGVLVPFNGHFHVPLLAAAAGGSLLTGIGGDEVLEPSDRLHLNRLVHGHHPPSRRTVGLAASAALPRRLRAFREARRAEFDDLRWLRPDALAELRRRYTGWVARQPLDFGRGLREWWWCSRTLQCNLAAKALLAADHDVEIAHPFADPGFLAAYAAERGPHEPPGRAWALRGLVGDVLPAAVIDRADKRSFNEAFWTDHARTVVAGWDGTGVDPDIVDPEALRREWQTPSPDSHSLALLQDVFLRGQARKSAASITPNKP